MLFSFQLNHFIYRDNEVHTKGHIISKFIKVPNDIGTLTNIALEYDKTTNVLTGWAYPDDWQLMGMSIFSAEEQRMWVALNFNIYSTYRIKSRCRTNFLAVTLPVFFIYKDEVFRSYDFLIAVLFISI